MGIRQSEAAIPVHTDDDVQNSFHYRTAVLRWMPFDRGTMDNRIWSRRLYKYVTESETRPTRVIRRQLCGSSATELIAFGRISVYQRLHRVRPICICAATDVGVL